jgi:hypothetical protein
MERSLCTDLQIKFEHQIERIEHLTGLVPTDKLNWVPPLTNGFTFTVLLGHIMECVAGIAATLYAAKPEELGHLLDLKRLTGNQQVGITTAKAGLHTFQESLREAFGHLTDHDLARLIPTVFVPKGESVLTLMFINYEHLASYKYQLFLWLRMAGVRVESRDLYHFSGL